MLAAGTLRGIRTISLLVLLVPFIGYAYSSPVQYLPSIPGYVPVYIRYGDEPLEEINPDLAEAFGETSNSIKSLQKIEHTLAHEPDSFNDDGIDVFLEESKRKHAYPLHVREAQSRSFATVNNDDPNKPKLLTIYELPDDNESRPRRRYRGRTRMKNWKPPAFKVSPLSNEEKEELEKLAVEVEKEETRPNELYMPNSRYPELPERTHRHKGHNFVAPMKVQHTVDESSANLPEISQVTDLSKRSYNYDTAKSEAGEKELPIKEQRPATILSNVDKVSRIDLLGESKTNEETASKAEKTKEESASKESKLPEISRDIDLPKSSDDHNTAIYETDKKEPPIKVQRPTTILSNVDKLLPVSLPDKSKTSEDNKTKDSTESNDEVATE